MRSPVFQVALALVVLLVAGLALVGCTSKTTPTPTPTPTPIQKSVSFKVGAGSTYTVDIIPPWDNARVEGSVASSTDINFLLKDPQGNNISRYDRITRVPFTFIASQRGTYQLVFDNSFSTFTSKDVNLGYIIYWR